MAQEREEIDLPDGRMNWIQRLGRLFGTRNRRRQILSRELRELSTSENLWRQRHQEMFTRSAQYFESQKHARDASELVAGNADYFHEMADNLSHGDAHDQQIGQQYTRIANAMERLPPGLFQTTFRQQIHPQNHANQQILNSFMRHTKWYGVRNNTDKIMDRHAPSITEAVLHAYSQDDRLNRLMNQLRNLHRVYDGAEAAHEEHGGHEEAHH